MNFFTSVMHIPAPLAFLAIAAEFLGGLALLVGFLASVAALGIAVNMLIAIWKVHLHMGFFMNWGGTQRGEGFEPFAGVSAGDSDHHPRRRSVVG